MCWSCDNPQATKADHDDRMWALINRYGWAIQSVEPTRIHPPWAYTVGLTEYGKPELVVTGMTTKPAGDLLNKIAAHVVHAQPPAPGTQMQLVGGPFVEYVTVTEPSAHLHTAVSLFGQRIRAIQIVHADARGHWPWHPGYRGGRGGQPVLGLRTANAGERG
jgi:Domain of unknown function (DUF4262)